MSPREDHLELLKALAQALAACNEAGDPLEHPIARITLGPIELHGMHDGWKYCHSADVTAAGLIEALQMLGATPAGPDRPARFGSADTSNTPENQARFVIEHQSLAAQMTDVFQHINPRDTLATVLDRREVDMPDAIQALDDVFGDIPDPYADEDDDEDDD